MDKLQWPTTMWDMHSRYQRRCTSYDTPSQTHDILTLFCLQLPLLCLLSRPKFPFPSYFCLKSSFPHPTGEQNCTRRALDEELVLSENPITYRLSCVTSVFGDITVEVQGPVGAAQWTR